MGIIIFVAVRHLFCKVLTTVLIPAQYYTGIDGLTVCVPLRRRLAPHLQSKPTVHVFGSLYGLQ